MKFLVTIDVNPLGVPAQRAKQIVARHLPEYITDGGQTIQITGCQVHMVGHDDPPKDESATSARWLAKPGR